MKLVSACLCGINCRYDGMSQFHSYIAELVKNHQAIPICPEQLAGLTTPRDPCEIQTDGQVLDKNGINRTAQFTRGAKEALKLAQLINCSEAILKDKSPMCGAGQIHDGSFTGQLITGDGIFTRLLKQSGIKITKV